TALELGEDAARRATLALAVFPLSFFLQAVYSESFFLALAVGAFLAARTGRWTLAGAATALAFLTRPTAIGLWLALLLLAWRAPERRRALASVAPAPLAFGLFPLLLWRQTGDALAFAHDESYWHRSLSSLGPIGGIVDGARAFGHGIASLVAGTTPADWNYPANLTKPEVGGVNVEAFCWLVLFCVLAVVVWRVLGAAYGVFAAVSLLVPLAEPWQVFPLFSLPRFGLVIFPFFMVLGAVTRARAQAASNGAPSCLAHHSPAASTRSGGGTSSVGWFRSTSARSAATARACSSLIASYSARSSSSLCRCASSASRSCSSSRSRCSSCARRMVSSSSSSSAWRTAAS